MSEKVNAVLLKICNVVEYEVDEGLNGELIDQLSKFKDNEAYLYWNLENDENSSKDD